MYSVSKQLEIFLWIAATVSLIPYRYLFVRSICAIWAVLAFVDSFNYIAFLIFGKAVFSAYLVKASLSLMWVLYIWFRDYDQGSDPLDEESFFLVGIRPKGAQDFLLSLLKEPVGGVGIYAQGQFFHYRKGRLQVHDRKYLERSGQKYRIRRVRPVDAKRLQTLQHLIGSKYEKWGLKYNCKTVLEPILGERAKPFWR